MNQERMSRALQNEGKDKMGGSPELQESREQGPSPIAIYVHEQEWRSKYTQTERGTIETVFDKPEVHKVYAWKGKLWQREQDTYKLDTVSSSDRPTLKELATNLAQNVKSNRNPKIRSSYRMSFEISDDLVRQIKKRDADSMTNNIRRLSPAEEQEFHTAFKEALEELQK